MPSRDSDDTAPVARTRRAVEFALRVVAVVALLAALVRASGWWSSTRSANGEAPLMATIARNGGGTAPLLSTIQRALSSPRGVRRMHAVANAIPDDTTRALLSAARAGGVSITWTDSTRQSALAIEADALVDPRGGIAVRVAAPSATVLAIRDTLGVIDSVRPSAGGATMRMGRAAGMLSASTLTSRARVVVPSPSVLRRVLLIARPGWEAKFTLAALEECGWSVDAKFAIAPRVTVTQGVPTAPDTATYAAVVALDSAALPMAVALERYVQQGGGVVLVGEAATLGALGPLLAGHAGARQAGIPGGLLTPTPRAGLAFWPIAPRADAVVIERSARGAASLPVTAAWRHGAGRVMQVGYYALWEWRMQSGEGSVEAHRDWWGRVVSSVAFAPTRAFDAAITDAASLPGDAAPYADLVARLGAPGTMPSRVDVTTGDIAPDPWLFVIAAMALLAEWGSRRLRGAR